MKSKEFIGRGVVKYTPSGGKVHVAFGDLITEEGKALEAIAIQIKDKNGGLVAEFALQPDSFGVLIEAIKDLYDGTFNNEQPV